MHAGQALFLTMDPWFGHQATAITTTGDEAAIGFPLLDSMFCRNQAVIQIMENYRCGTAFEILTH